MRQYGYLFFMVALFVSCSVKETKNPFDQNAPKLVQSKGRSASIGIVGDTADVKTITKAGLVIMGGGADVDEAFQWMMEQSGGGDVVIIRSSGTDAYNSYVDGLGVVNSVETLKIDSRKLADDESVARVIRNAEMLFIAGGDQADYVSYWKGTKVMEAINYLLTEKKVPVGGTSAGAAILGNYYFSGERGGLDSQEALANPYAQRVILGRDDFLKAPFLHNVIVDQHFSQRDRQGRSVVFLGRIMKDWNKIPYGIAIDEKTAVCIDENGIAKVLGANKAFFIKTEAKKKPEILETKKKVTWNREGKALSVAVVTAISGNRFNLNTFEPETTIGLGKVWWSVLSGEWNQTVRQ